MSGQLQSGCTFRLTLKSTHNKRHRVENLMTIRDKFSYTPGWNLPVIIVDVDCQHGGTCVPSRSNRIATSKRAGAYIDTMPIQAVYSLCNSMEHGAKLTG